MYGRQLNVGVQKTGIEGDKFAPNAENAQSIIPRIASVMPPIFSRFRFMINSRTITPKLTLQVDTQRWNNKKAEAYKTHGRNGKESNQIIVLPDGYAQ